MNIIQNNKKIYKYLSNSSKKEKCVYFKQNIIKYKNYYYNNDIYDKRKGISTKFKKFPDKSYYRLAPVNKKIDDILFYTYDVQNYIYAFQNPVSCSNRKFLLITGYPAGQGIELRVIASLLGLAIHTNRIALYHPFYRTIHTGGNYCKNLSQTWECFLEPLSNCSINKDYIRNAAVFSSYNQTDKVVYVSSKNIKNYLSFIPQFVKHMINFGLFNH